MFLETLFYYTYIYYSNFKFRNTDRDNLAREP